MENISIVEMLEKMKFRGKRVDNNEWVYGHLVKCGNKYYIIDEPEYKIYDIECGDYTSEFDCIEGFIYEVIPETIGLHAHTIDKNNKEIYVGDILFVKESGYQFYPYPNDGYIEINGLFIVKFELPNNGVFLESIEKVNLHPKHIIEIGMFKQESFEIVGNIYENRELLEAWWKLHLIATLD